MPTSSRGHDERGLAISTNLVVEAAGPTADAGRTGTNDDLTVTVHVSEQPTCRRCQLTLPFRGSISSSSAGAGNLQFAFATINNSTANLSNSQRHHLDDTNAA
jgi:hypothetical protein